MQTLLSPPHEVSVQQAGESLKPKEHGAYAILVIPILSSIAVAGVGLVGVAVAIASLAGFFAHEPLLVALGHRGPRAKRNSPAAKRRAQGLLMIAVVAGTLAMWMGSQAVRVSLLGCLILAGISFALAIGGRHRSLGGQLFGVLGLSIPCLPILLSGDLSVNRSLTIWAAWLVGFVSTTLAVRGVIAAQKQQSRTIHWGVLSMTTAGVAIAVMARIYLPLAAVPMIAASWYLMCNPPPARQLKRVGWTLVATTIVTAMIVIALPVF